MDDLKLRDTLIRCLSYSIKGKKLPKSFSEGIDEERLFKLCVAHKVAALVSLSMDQEDEKWQKQRMDSIRRTVLFDHERKSVLDALEKEKIWYCPLKGIVLKDDYPVFGIREFADNDILYDPEKKEEVKKIMLDLGFSALNVGNSNHAVFHKKPVFNFEMHHALFNESTGEDLVTYYADVKDKLLKDEENEFGFHFSDEDLYIYLHAHNHKHLSHGGSGFRFLTDLYFFIHKHQDLDWPYIEAELKKLKIYEEEETIKSLALKIFEDDPVLSKEEDELLNYIVSSGAYGTLKNNIVNTLSEYKKDSRHYKLKFIYRRLFLDETSLKVNHPFFYKHVWARPFLMLYRLFRGLCRHASKIFMELRILSQEGRKDD